MTGFDVGLSLFVVLGALVGLVAGASKQLVQLAAWAAGYAASYYLAAPVARAIRGPLEVAYPVALAFAAVALSVLAWLSVRILLWKLFKPRKDRDEGSALAIGDRVGGAVIGAAKSALLVWAVLSAAVAVAEPLEAAGVGMRWSHGKLADVAREHNLWAMLFHDRIEQARLALQRARTRAGQSKAAAADWVDDARVKALLADRKLAEALESGQIEALTRSSPFLELVSDGDAVKRMHAALGGD